MNKGRSIRKILHNTALLVLVVLGDPRAGRIKQFDLYSDNGMFWIHSLGMKKSPTMVQYENERITYASAINRATSTNYYFDSAFFRNHYDYNDNGKIVAFLRENRIGQTTSWTYPERYVFNYTPDSTNVVKIARGANGAEDSAVRWTTTYDEKQQKWETISMFWSKESSSWEIRNNSVKELIWDDSLGRKVKREMWHWVVYTNTTVTPPVTFTYWSLDSSYHFSYSQSCLSKEYDQYIRRFSSTSVINVNCSSSGIDSVFVSGYTRGVPTWMDSTLEPKQLITIWNKANQNAVDSFQFNLWDTGFGWFENSRYVFKSLSDSVIRMSYRSWNVVDSFAEKRTYIYYPGSSPVSASKVLVSKGSAKNARAFRINGARVLGDNRNPRPSANPVLIYKSKN